LRERERERERKREREKERERERDRERERTNKRESHILGGKCLLTSRVASCQLTWTCTQSMLI
jgi:hypothetical protein